MKVRSGSDSAVQDTLKSRPQPKPKRPKSAGKLTFAPKVGFADEISNEAPNLSGEPNLGFDAGYPR
jgi:hypothetical protein